VAASSNFLVSAKPDLWSSHLNEEARRDSHLLARSFSRRSSTNSSDPNHHHPTTSQRRRHSLTSYLGGLSSRLQLHTPWFAYQTSISKRSSRSVSSDPVAETDMAGSSHGPLKSKPESCAIFVHAGAGFHSVQNEKQHLRACKE
jgi:hypothetical protein